MNQNTQKQENINNIQEQLKKLEQNPTTQQLYDISWLTLNEGVKNRHIGSRVMQLGTFDTLKKQVEMRTVVNRMVYANEQIIKFHTDIRSPKWQQLNIHLNTKAPVSIHIYEPQLKLQLRLQAMIHFLGDIHHKSELQQTIWNTLNSSQKQTYSLPYVSRETIEKPFQIKDITFIDDEIAQQNFAIVALKVIEIDTLYLSAFGHIRGLFFGDNLEQQHFINY